MIETQSVTFRDIDTGVELSLNLKSQNISVKPTNKNSPMGGFIFNDSEIKTTKIVASTIYQLATHAEQYLSEYLQSHPEAQKQQSKARKPF